MKKVLLVAAAIGFGFNGIAQEKYVVSANVALSKQSYDEAKDNIDKAMASPETKDKPKTLFVKGQVYLALQTIDKYKAMSPYREGVQAVLKLVEIKPDYEKSTVDQLLLIGGYFYYNDGVKAYNDKKFADAAEYMRNVIKIRELGGGKRFDKFQPSEQKKFDTVAAESNQTMAMSLSNLGKYDEAIPLLMAVKSNPITRSPAIYETIIFIYNTQEKSNEAYAMIQEARKAYPDDVAIRNYELNYFIKSGKQDELVKKLEDAAAKDPSNADIQFNIATSYLTAASPKSGPKPANVAELLSKSEAAFQKALQLAPNNAGYNYNFGALYFNQATDVNDQMNAITGTSDADDKKYEALKAKRDEYFSKSTPYFEKAYSIMAATEKDLAGNEKATYKNVILALKEVYARQNKMDKSAEMKKKYESL
ncbi:MAG: hypothetical protein K0Q79_3543 [Flavipsychrobacter sp.]|jgi:hypothetical protein|nr:hypothetical protein [Flavipsychrobacter sp.]